MIMITKEQAQAQLDQCGEYGCRALFCTYARTIIALQDLRAMVAAGPPAQEAVETWIKAVMDKAASLKDGTK